MEIIFIALLLLSIFITYKTMDDLDTPKEIKNLINKRKARGTILFFKKKIKHYSSSLSSSSSEE